MFMAVCFKKECKLPVLIKNTWQIVVYEKFSYLYGVMVSHTSNRTAVRQVKLAELPFLL